MDDRERDDLIKNINDRTLAIEKILPTLATKDDVQKEVQREGERTRRHFDVVAEQSKTDIAVIAEGHKALGARLTAENNEIRATLSAHDRRIMKLEADRLKGR